MLELNEESVAEFIKSGKVIIKACASDGKCGYCEKFCPTFEEASKLFPDVRFGSILVPVFKPAHSDFKTSYMKKEPVNGKSEFYGTPTTLIFQDGVLKSRVMGNLPLEMLKKFIETGEEPKAPVPQQQDQLGNLYRMKGELITALEVNQAKLQEVNQQISKLLGLAKA